MVAQSLLEAEETKKQDLQLLDQLLPYNKIEQELYKWCCPITGMVLFTGWIKYKLFSTATQHWPVYYAYEQLGVHLAV